MSIFDKGMMDVIIILYILGAISITLYLIYLFGYSQGYRDHQEESDNRPALDLSMLSEIPGLRIEGPGVNINTSEMKHDIKRSEE
jgi:hypothetical protein